jgi:hypothetical protein
MSAPREQPPEEVLRRAIINNALLDHVGISGRVHVSSDVFSGAVLFRGGIEGGGLTWWGVGTTRIVYSSSAERSTFSGSLTALSLDHRTLGVRIDSAQGMLGDRLLSSIVRSDTPPWLMLSFATGAVALPARSHLDADNVDALLASVKIVSSQPLTKKSFHSYVYTVTVETRVSDSSPHSSWRGDLVIDGTTFELLSVHWRAQDAPPTATLQIDDINLVFDSQITVEKPHIEGAVVPLTLQSLTDIILGKPLVP